MTEPRRGPVIAIDGPAGTGKSSASRRLAEALGYIQIDTGALYRAIAWICLDRGGLDRPDVDPVAVARSTHLEFRRIQGKNPANRIFADGRDLTEVIRSPEVSMAASRVSAIPGVRAALLGLQRKLGAAGKAILEGRDIGTVVFPDADVKFFLSASVDERAKRRLIELEAAGSDAPSFEEVRRQIEDRDRGDSSRTVAPLRRAEDAIDVDTSGLTLDEVVGRMAQMARERIRG